jgi:hypothetical protein
MISKDKTYRTRDGREVRIYATDGCGRFPIHGAVKISAGWLTKNWTLDGHQNPEESWSSDLDLIEVKPRIKRTVWLNVFGDHVYGAYTKEGVDIHPYVDSRLACVKVEIDVEEGEGL